VFSAGLVALLAQGTKVVMQLLVAVSGNVVGFAILMIFATLAIGSAISLVKVRKMMAAGVDPKAKWEG